MSPTNGGYHYLGAAKILAPIGKAFAKLRRGDGKVAADPNADEALKRFIDGRAATFYDQQTKPDREMTASLRQA